MNATLPAEPTPFDRGSLPMAMLITVVALSLSAALAPVVVRQMSVTRNGMARTAALDAAQAGIDVAVAQIRAANDGSEYGVLEDLPGCELTGVVGPTNAIPSLGYAVTISYRDAAGITVGCPPLSVPATAILSATGTAAAGSAAPKRRTITAKYNFRTSNANTDGGAIRTLQPFPDTVCMDSGVTGSPPAGQRLTMQRCVTGSSRQRFAYTKTLAVKLIGSETGTAPTGMCLDAASQAVGTIIRFQRCDVPLPRQQWSLNGYANFQGTSNGTSVNGPCFNVRNPSVDGSEVVLGGCNTTANQSVFRAEAGVGAGMAGASTAQLVNFKQFSRCLDIAGGNVNFNYMLVWYCKQSPNGNVDANQRWTLANPVKPAVTASGPIRSGYATSYCLKSPLSTAAGQYVRIESCAAAGVVSASQQWTVYGATGVYATSFQITDSVGNCLTPTAVDVVPSDVHGDGTAKTKVAVCDGSELQKWNAPPNLGDPLPLSNISEN